METDVAHTVFALAPIGIGRPIQKRVLPLVQPIASSYSSETSKSRNANNLP